MHLSVNIAVQHIMLQGRNRKRLVCMRGIWVGYVLLWSILRKKRKRLCGVQLGVYVWMDVCIEEYMDIYIMDRGR